jgi:hypothetical protein
MYIELLDEIGSTITRQKADASGRFTFRGLSNGRYVVKVLPYGTDYLVHLEEVTLASVSAVSGSGADQQHIDIYLRVNERANANPFGRRPAQSLLKRFRHRPRNFMQRVLAICARKKRRKPSRV